MRVAVVGEPAGWHVGRLTERLTAMGHRAAAVRWHEIGAAAGCGRDRFSPAELDEARDRRRSADDRDLADFRAVAPAVLSFAQGRRR